ncbi:DUF6766 family protein [Actinopolymorpha sp. B11F2]|uniref:DUF6766 family protein n=1 Tax=Actinopolymorpha sp. B11F2 TaxID=3160862 RepID=UPI0032E3977E
MRTKVRSFLRNNSLTLAFGLAFLATLTAQALVGLAAFNERQVAEGFAQVSFVHFVMSSDFGVDVMENWQSEYLQFFLYVFGTVWLIQRGSPESKPADKTGWESDEVQLVGPHADEKSPAWARAGGIRLKVYSHSLALVMGTIFLMSWFAQSVAGRVAYNQTQIGQLQLPLTWLEYIVSADFWNRTLQNWQSEMLALVSMAVLSVYLRQRGSPESKPVGAPHDTATGRTG